MTSFETHHGAETVVRWLRDQVDAAAVEAEALADAEPADAVARLLFGLAVSLAGYLLIQDATAVSGTLVVSYALAGRAAATVVGLLGLRVGAPRVLSGLRTVKKVRAGDYADSAEEASA